MHPELLSLHTLAIVLGGIVVLGALALWGLYRHQQQKREAMRRGNEIYKEWLAKQTPASDDTTHEARF